MSTAILFGLNAETLLALNGLTDAIRSLTGGVSGGLVPSSANVDGAPTGELIYWRDPKTNELGFSVSEAEYKMAKKANANLMKIPQGKYDTLIAERAAAGSEPEEEEKEEEEEPTETPAQKKKRLAAEAAAKKKADEAAAAKEKAKAAGSDDDTPSEQDMIDAFGGYLSPDLDKEERKERAAWVRPLVARFGAARASEIAEDDRKLALNLLQRKMAGQEVDAENDDYEEFEADEAGLV